MKLALALLAVAAAATAVDATGLVGTTCSYGTTAPPLPPVDCELYSIVSDPFPWGPCVFQNSTGQYARSKLLSVKTEPAHGGKPCLAVDDPLRTVQQVCGPVDCVPLSPVEDTEPFGDCIDNGSGKFYKTKVLGIKVPAQNGGKCDEADRTIQVACNAVPCVVNTPDEDQGAFGPCLLDLEASSPRYLKTKVLGIKTPAQNGGSCPSEDARKYSRECPPVNCVPLTPEEDTGDYGPCQLVDGKYVKAKVLGVKTPAQYGGTCEDKDRTFTQPCAAIDCVVKSSVEDTGPFGNCSDNGSGTFFQSRVLGIKVEPQFGGVPCPAEANRTESIVCAPVKCVPLSLAEDTAPFGNCTDDGTGKFFKTKVLGIKEPAQNGGTCLEEDRTVRELCEGVPCVVFSAVEDKGEFGPCLLDSESYIPRYLKTKILGIKTPAQNGGSCPSEDARKYEEVCPPVDCVLLTPAEDTGPFGNCTPNATGTFFRTKRLGIKTPPQYGGTCDETNRTYTELCPPVNCVVNTPDEDNGKFSNCTRFADGQYYRTKVLGIKTPAQNGGGCPPAEARTLKQACPNDGYCLPSDPFYDLCIPKLAQCGAKKKGIVYVGNTIHLLKGLALWACCDKCTATAGCVAYSFVPSSDAKNNECYLKWAIGSGQPVYGTAVSSSPMTVKPKTCSYFDDRTLVSFVGTTLATIPTNDLDLCCTKCQATKRCKAFRITDGTCYLQSDEGTRVWWPGTRAGYLR